MRFYTGTSGWQYRHWKGRFYPGDLAVARWLEYYAHAFETVEINSSFYRQPTERSWDRWRATVPDGFRFAVKASRFLTHIKRLEDPGDSIERVVEGARRLGDRLGPILYQLPPNFMRTAENVERLEGLLALLPPDLQHAVEFRHRSWFNDATYEVLRARRVAICMFHMPHLETPEVATARFAYLRFHGSGSTYGGDYPDDVLRNWAGRIERLNGVDEAWVYFNNDIGGYAVENAKTFRAFVRE
jgi:uncharacterized protein YecE (DUF72 family)